MMEMKRKLFFIQVKLAHWCPLIVKKYVPRSICRMQNEKTTTKHKRQLTKYTQPEKLKKYVGF